MDVGAVRAPTIRRSYPCKRLRPSGDITKSVFQVHGVDAEGNVILRWQLKRRYVSFGSLLATLWAAVIIRKVLT
jgi:hypothetical protein